MYRWWPLASIGCEISTLREITTMQQACSVLPHSKNVMNTCCKYICKCYRYFIGRNPENLVLGRSQGGGSLGPPFWCDIPGTQSYKTQSVSLLLLFYLMFNVRLKLRVESNIIKKAISPGWCKLIFKTQVIFGIFERGGAGVQDS